jgi:hypothetical protein
MSACRLVITAAAPLPEGLAATVAAAAGCGAPRALSACAAEAEAPDRNPSCRAVIERSMFILHVYANLVRR